MELSRSLHPKAQPQFDEGPVEPEFRLGYVTLMTTPSAAQQRAINQLLADQQNPASPSYHKWLTPEQYADRFGLSPNDVARLTAWLKSQGLAVVNVARGRNSITVSGTAAQFESMFQTEIHRYNVNGQIHFANATPLKMPALLSGIVTRVRGLHNFYMRPYGVRRRPELHPDYFDAMVGQLLAPDDVATIYDLGPLYTANFDGTGESLAVVGQTDIYLADLAAFRSGFNLPAISGCTVNASGVVTACNGGNFGYVTVPGETDPHTPGTCGDLSEADLDLEWSNAVARGAKIIFVNSPLVWNATCTNPTNSNGGVEAALSQAIQGDVAPVISMSYGICEAQAGDDEAELTQANLQGQTVLNSTGDVGAAGCDFNPPNATRPFQGAVGGQAVSYPASSPSVTGVGGTHIPIATLNDPTIFSQTNGTNFVTALQYAPEVGWNDDSEFALFCHTHTTNTFCLQGGTPAISHWVALGAAATAAQVQEDIWISSSGGGVSNCFVEPAGVCASGFPKPAYQSALSVAGIPAQLSTYRLVPDVSLMASPNFPGYILCTPLSEIGVSNSTASSCANGIPNAVDPPNLSIIGGTSASAPIFAGIVTVLNQYLAGSASPGLGNINTKLYSLAAVPGNLAFHPITAGTNIVTCQPHTPAIQTTLPSIQCPVSGSLGYDAFVNFDVVTNYNPVAGLGSVDAHELALAWSASRAASSTGLGASPTHVILDNSTTLTATVTPGTATGNVSFFDNGSTTALATVALNGSGVAVFNWTPTNAQIGSNSITASYAGDGTNGTSTSSPVVVTVAAPTFTLATSGGTAHTVLAGQTTQTYSFTVTPTSSAHFEDNVTLSCSLFAPADSTLTASSCAFSPSATINAGAAATAVTMTITSKGPNTGTGSALQHRADKRSPWLPLALPLAGIVLVGLAGRKGPKFSALALLSVCVICVGALIACGGGGSAPVTVAVNPGAVSLFPNNTGWPAQGQAFGALVGNTSNTAVNWSVSAGGGSIDASGNYTAPTVAAGLPASATVTATSQADASKTGTAIVTLKPATLPAVYTVTVTAAESATQHSQNVTMTVN